MQNFGNCKREGISADARNNGGQAPLLVQLPNRHVSLEECPARLVRIALVKRKNYALKKDLALLKSKSGLNFILPPEIELPSVHDGRFWKLRQRAMVPRKYK